MWATLEAWIAASFSTIPPVWPAPGLVWRFTIFTPCTTTRFSSRSTRSTSPLLPLSRPVMITTLSPFLILSFISEHLGSERHDLHELARAQLARDRPEDARADRLALLGDQHRGVAVEADRAAVRPADLLGRAHDHRLMHVALLDAAARDRLLDRDDDDVAHSGRLALGAAQHLDALDAPRARIVGHIEIGLHLDHDASPLGAGSGGGLLARRARCTRLRRLLRRSLRGSGGRHLARGRRRTLGEHHPALAPGDRPGLLDADHLAALDQVVLVVRRILLRAHDEFLVDRVHDAALDTDDHGLVPCVPHRHALKDTLRHRSSLSLCARAFGQDGPDARHVASHLAHARRVLELSARLLEAQVEALLRELLEVALELVVRLGSDVCGFHIASSPRRVTTRVATGSLAEARSKASRAIGPGTPSSSNMMRPGFTRH